MPRALAGDLRTARANAMRPNGWQPGRAKGRQFRHRVDRANPIAWPPAGNLDGNPNKGASRQKIIGLPRDWSQPVRMEVWQYPRRIRPAYFFVCPGHIAPGSPGVDARPAQHFESRAARGAGAAPGKPAAMCDHRLAPLSTRKPGRKHPSDKSGGYSGAGCPQRCLKLMMVQCTPQERRDADFAQSWINSIPQRLRIAHQSQINRLIERYGLIFNPRVLLCPRCLGAKYGNNPETVRQGWRRRHNRPDTTFAAADLRRVAVRMSYLQRLQYERQQAERERQSHPMRIADSPVLTAMQKERRRAWQRAYYRRNARRINQQTVERRRRKRHAKPK